MGIGESKISPGPKIFFLVFGGPSITYRRGVDSGPLIFNVEPMERRVEPPASAETRKCPVYCSAKQPFKLKRVGGSRDGWQLQFTIDSVSSSCVLRLYAGVTLDYDHANGFGLKRTHTNQSQFCVAEEILQPGSNIVFDKAHTPIALGGLDTTSTASHEEVFSRLSASPLAIEIASDHSREEGSDADQTRCFIFLTFNKSDLEDDGGDVRDFIPAACVKQYIFTGGELFETDDIFDLRGDQAPSSPNEGGRQDASPGEEVEVEDDATCVVCLTNERNTTIIPCRHMCVCAECAGLLQQNSGKCPMCRCEIQKLLTLSSHVH